MTQRRPLRVLLVSEQEPSATLVAVRAELRGRGHELVDGSDEAGADVVIVDAQGLSAMDAPRIAEIVEKAAAPTAEDAEAWAPAALRRSLTLAELEREYIRTVLASHGGHRGRTARTLGIDPKTLYNKLGTERPRKKKDEG